MENTGEREKSIPTGLHKTCPRCGRNGEVFLENDVTGPSFTVVWSGSPRGGTDKDQDVGVSLKELIMPSFGCGFDPAEG